MGSPDTRSSFDVAVIGGGVIGLACGWRVAQAGARVVVLDAGPAGSGATRAAAGMLAPVTEATFGEEELLRLNLEAADRYPAFTAELEQLTGADVGYRPCGTLAVALDRDDAEALRRLHDFQLSHGLDVEWLSGSECRRLEPALAPRVAGGVRSGLDHQVEPRALTAALAIALARAGGELREGCEVSVDVRGDSVTGLTLSGGERIASELVVVAAGWRSGELAGLPAGAGVPVRPVKGQILRLRTTMGTRLPGRVVRAADVYVVPRERGELVVGATVEECGDTAVTAGAVLDLLRAAYEALPGVTEMELVEATAGLRPGTPDNRAFVGPGRLTGLVWATGHWRNGILLAPLTADAVAAVVAGEELPERLGPFSPARLEQRPQVTGALGS